MHEASVKLSFVICHDGTLYGIYDVSKEFEPEYKKALEIAKTKTTDEDEAKRLAMTSLYLMNDAKSTRNKLFDVRIL